MYNLNKLVMLLVFLCSLVAVSSADASPLYNWVLCDSCSTPSDFASAARSWYGTRTVRTRVFVGNTKTGRVYSMWLQPNTGPGGGIYNPMSVPGFGDVVKVVPKSSVVSSDMLVEGYAVANSIMVSEEIREAGVEPDFKRTVIAVKTRVLFNVSSSDMNSPIYSSFSASVGMGQEFVKMPGIKSRQPILASQYLLLVEN